MISTSADYYEAIVTTASDYYPFGWQMPNRKLNAGNYSFGFNGQIQDPEWMGGQSVAFEFRTQDARIARFLSTDPLTATTPWETPYAFAGNSPIMNIDFLGLTAAGANGGGGGPIKRFGLFKRIGNWLKGKGYLNKANKYASENGIEDWQIQEGDGKVTITEAKLTSPESFEANESDDSYNYSLETNDKVFAKKKSFIGKAAAYAYEFTSGVANTYSAANIGTDVTNRHGDDSYSDTYRAGQIVGNVVAGVQAASEIVAAKGLILGGGTGTVVSGGTLAWAGAPAIAGGIALSGHGTYVWNNVWNNSMKMSSNGPGGGGGNWPWKKRATISDLNKGGGNCKVHAEKIKDMVGGKIIRIFDRLGAPGIGKVTHPNGKVVSHVFTEHFAVRKGDMIYDRITGSNGMHIDEYKKLFEYHKFLNFD